jgi:hypothetical protein
MKREWLLGLCMAVGVAFYPSTHSAQVNIQAKVSRTLVAEEGLWGGCMAQLSVDPQTLLPACASGWVTFSCSGEHVSKDIAYRMLDTAQLAQVTDKSVFLIVTDDKTHNGYCFIRRIDVY